MIAPRKPYVYSIHTVIHTVQHVAQRPRGAKLQHTPACRGSRISYTPWCPRTLHHHGLAGNTRVHERLCTGPGLPPAGVERMAFCCLGYTGSVPTHRTAAAKRARSAGSKTLPRDAPLRCSRVADMASARGRYAMAQARGVVAIHGSFEGRRGGHVSRTLVICRVLLQTIWATPINARMAP
jgi:hypothetical protein